MNFGEERMPDATIAAGSVLEKTVDPYGSYACVAPSYSWRHDPTVLKIATLVYPHGNCTVVDAQYGKRKIAPSGKYGAGDYKMYEEELALLQQAGLPIEFPDFVLGDICATGLPSGQFTGLTDHMSAQFVTHSVTNIKDFGVIWDGILQEHARVLQRNGELILFTDLKAGMARTVFGNARGQVPFSDVLRNNGFGNIERYPVRDEWAIPVPESALRDVVGLAERYNWIREGVQVSRTPGQESLQHTVGGILFSHRAAEVWLAQKE